MADPLVQQEHRVYTKLNWSDATWTEQTNLFADYAVFSCAPDISKAQLHWRYGRVMGYGETSYTNREKKELLDYYVKIEIDRPNDESDFPQAALEWYGIVVSDSRELDGRRIVDGVRVGAGTQAITCLGLEYLLTRKTIDTSLVEDGSGGFKTIKRAIAFNLGAGHDNSSVFWPNAGGEGPKVGNVFDDRLDGSSTWTSYMILRYLLDYQTPTSENGDLVLDWKLDDTGNAEHLKWHKPMLRVHGHTLYDVLNMLIDRRRLSSWKVTVSGGNPQIKVFTFNSEDVDLPDGKIILANEDQYDWNFDTTELVRQPTLTRDATSEFAKVTARGERRGYCFTLNSSQLTLEGDWSAALQTEYNAGASAAATYAAADTWGKQSLNQVARNRERLKRVYRYFRIPPTWDGKVNLVTTLFENFDDPFRPESFWVPGMRFESFIPLKTDIDYGDTIVAEDLSATTGDTLAKSKKEFRRPFVVINTGTRYEPVDQLSKGDSTDEVATNGRNWSCSIRMADDAPSIVLDVSGPPQHVIALDEFTAVDSSDTDDWPAELRWQTIYATIFMQGDQYAEQTWPDVAFPTTDDVQKVLIIDVPNMRLDYVAPSTVVALNTDGSLKQTANGGYIHDDREKLKEIARVAYEWYSTPRQSFDASEHTYDVFLVGDLIHKIGTGTTEETVNSVVTQLAIDLRRGVASYKTAFGELDFTRVNSL